MNKRVIVMKMMMRMRMVVKYLKACCCRHTFLLILFKDYNRNIDPFFLPSPLALSVSLARAFFLTLVHDNSFVLSDETRSPPFLYLFRVLL